MKISYSTAGRACRDLEGNVADVIKINKNKYDYELTKKGNEYTIKLNNETYTYELFKVGDELITRQGNRYFKVPYYLGRESTIVWINGCQYNISEVDVERIVEEENNERDIKSPMPGIIKEVLVEKGQKVTKGETVVILESMKMSNELKASTDGIIKEVYVTTGEQVDAFATLVSFE
jgi:3-methylcrotonyl-CoA carboxylase alpha subunit